MNRCSTLISRSLVNLAVAAACGAAAPAAFAQAEAASPMMTTGFKWALSMGLTFGGDKLGSYDISTAYGGTNTESVRAGGNNDIRLGFDHRFTDTWAVQFGVGYHSDRVSAQNGSASFQNFPLDLTGSWRVPAMPVRLGLGIRKPLSPKFHEGGAAGNLNVSLSSTTSPLVYVEYMFDKFGARLQGSLSEKFKAPGATKSIDGSNVGLYGTFYF